MRWGNLEALWICFGSLLLLVFIWLANKKNARDRETFVSSKLFFELNPTFSAARVSVKQSVLCFVLFLMGIVAARPQLGFRMEDVEVSGRDLLFVLDVSNSMLAEDLPPNRIQKAKKWVASLVGRLGNDRAGMVVFAGSAYLYIPLTEDLEYFLESLSNISTELVYQQGTNLGEALRVASEALDRGGVDRSSKVVVLLSDGEDLENQIEAGLTPFKKNKPLFVSVGIGSESGAKIPLRDESGALRGYKLDLNRKEVVTRLDAQTLSKLASDLNGHFFRMTPSENEINDIVQLIKNRETQDRLERGITNYEEIFQWPLGLAILVFLIELCIPRKKKQIKNTALAAVLVLGFCGTQHAQAYSGILNYFKNEKAKKAIEEEKYDDAAKILESLNSSDSSGQISDRSQPIATYNQGVLNYQNKDFQGSTKKFDEAHQEATKTNNPSLNAKSLYNLGSSLEANQDMDGAIENYIQAIEQAKKNQDPETELAARQRIEMMIQNPQKKPDEKKEQSKQKNEFDSKKIDKQQAEQVMEQMRQKENQVQQKVLKKNKRKAPLDKDW